MGYFFTGKIFVSSSKAVFFCTNDIFFLIRVLTIMENDFFVRPTRIVIYFSWLEYQQSFNFCLRSFHPSHDCIMQYPNGSNAIFTPSFALILDKNLFLQATKVMQKETMAAGLQNMGQTMQMILFFPI